ncbi:MAG: hypothetical protein SGI77_15710 [Pirellulaceae bacterium]|nr:hypothetical protein [Pirellulaceae bacterium]
MIRRLCFSSLFAGLLMVGTAQSVQAYDSAFGFAFGYSLGQANQFRNRLPAPPYFAIHPPVYYGQRHERPYGESPFASWPLLQSNENYQVRAKQSPLEIANPHVPTATPCASCGVPVAEAVIESTGKFVMIDNPFVISSEAIASSDVNE